MLPKLALYLLNNRTLHYFSNSIIQRSNSDPQKVENKEEKPNRKNNRKLRRNKYIWKIYIKREEIEVDKTLLGI